MNDELELTEDEQRLDRTPRIKRHGHRVRRMMRDSIKAALEQEHIMPDGAVKKKFDAVAEALVRAAINGDIQAIKEINDRIDGKVQVAGGEDKEPVLIARIERVVIDPTVEELEHDSSAEETATREPELAEEKASGRNATDSDS